MTVSAWSALIWVIGAGVLGWIISALFAGKFRLPRGCRISSYTPGLQHLFSELAFHWYGWLLSGSAQFKTWASPRSIWGSA